MSAHGRGSRGGRGGRGGRGSRGGRFPPGGRGVECTCTSSESHLTLKLNLQVRSQETIELQHDGNRGTGSRRRSNHRPPGGFQSHPGTPRGQSHASSRGSFQKHKPPVPSFHNLKEKPADGKMVPSSRGQPRGGKMKPSHRGRKDQGHHTSNDRGSGSQQTGNKKKIDNMKKSVCCGICLEVWTRPKTLPCDHVFCENCLEKIVIRNRQVVTCPECRQEHRLPPQGLRNSWFTHRYLESLADDFKNLQT